MVMEVLVLLKNLKSFTVDERGLTLMCDRIKYSAIELNTDRTKIRRRLKPRLHKRCPPPRTVEKNVIFTADSSTRGGGFCLCRRGFNRRMYFATVSWARYLDCKLCVGAIELNTDRTKIRRRLKPRLHKRCPPPRTVENNVIFTADSSTRGGGFCLCRRGFNRRMYFSTVSWPRYLD